MKKLSMQEALYRVFESQQGTGGKRQQFFWARPITWSGTGSAITINSDGQLVILNTVDGEDEYVPFTYEIFDAWELVSLTTLFREMGIMGAKK